MIRLTPEQLAGLRERVAAELAGTHGEEWDWVAALLDERDALVAEPGRVNYAEIRLALADLSGIPMMAVGTNQHVAKVAARIAALEAREPTICGICATHLRLDGSASVGCLDCAPFGGRGAVWGI